MVQISVGAQKYRTDARIYSAPTIGDALRGIDWAEAWWSPFEWAHSKRSAADWVGSVAVVLDVDYHDAAGAKAAPSNEEVQALTVALQESGLCSAWHTTPHGARLVWEFADMVRDRQVYLLAQAGCINITREILSIAGVHATGSVRLPTGKTTSAGGYFVDPAALDLAHFMWAPTTTADGVPRSAQVHVCNTQPFQAQELTTCATSDAMEDVEGSAAAGVAVDDDEISAALAKLPADGTNDGSEACIRCARRAVGLGVETAEQFVRVATRWNDKRKNPWTAEELIRRFNDAVARWEAEGRAKVPVGRYTVAALIKILAEDREYKDRLVFDVTEQLVRRDMELVNDIGITKIRGDICKRYGYASIPREDLRDALAAEASKRMYDRVASYLAGLEWDGEPRMVRLTRALCPVAPHLELAESYVTKILIAAVARRAQPGCKVDNVLVLIGDEGQLKSTVFRILAGTENFRDTSFDLNNKDAYAQIAKAWIYEWGELEAITKKADVSRVKNFLSSATDTYRVPYGRTVEDHPRRGIFIGTANGHDILVDPTSDRRWWVLEVGDMIDVDWVEMHRDQIWAEAIARYVAGEPWWLSKLEEQERRESNANYHPDSPMLDLLQITLESFEKQADFNGKIKSLELYRKLGLDPMGAPAPLKSQIGVAMRKFGWRYKRTNKSRFWSRF